MFGIPSLAAGAMSRKVEQAVASYRLRRDPLPVAGPAEIGVRLDAALAEILELTASPRGLLDLDQAVAYACARAEEWTA